MKKIFVLFPLLIFPTLIIFCQTIEDKFQIRKSFESAEDKKEPATTSFTLPKSKENSFLINAGISYNLVQVTHGEHHSVKMIFAPFFVYNRNTLIDKEQNNYKLGITHRYDLGNLDVAQRRINYFFLNSTLQYQRDISDTSHSLIITTYLSQIRSGDQRGSFYINTYKSIGGGFEYFFGWSAGFEYQNKFEAKNSSEVGAAVRTYYNLEFRLAKKIATEPGGNASLGRRLIELVGSNTGRYDIINTTSIKEGYLPLIKTEIVLYPTASENFSLGFSYNTGSNPVAGLPNQDFFALALKFKK